MASDSPQAEDMSVTLDTGGAEPAGRERKPLPPTGTMGA